MIECITGAPGAGKSMYGVIRMIRALKVGRPVYSNLYPRWPNTWRWSNWLGMADAGEGLFVVDEAQMWFNSRAFKDNTTELGSWQQSRKRGADLIWIAQHENRVDVAIRELTSVLWRPRLIGPLLLAKGETLEGTLVGWEWAFWKGFKGSYYTDQIVGERGDPNAVLARVSPALYAEPELRVASPSHAYMRDGRLVDYVPGLPAVVLLYRDYEGRWLEIGPGPEFCVLGVISSPDAAYVRVVRASLRARGGNLSERLREIGAEFMEK